MEKIFNLDEDHICIIKVDVRSYTYMNAEVYKYDKDAHRRTFKTSISKLINKPNLFEKIFRITYEQKIENGIESLKEKADLMLKEILGYEEISRRV